MPLITIAVDPDTGESEPNDCSMCDNFMEQVAFISLDRTMAAICEQCARMILEAHRIANERQAASRA